MKFAACHSDRKHKAHGLCASCYQNRPRPRLPAQCGHADRPSRARGLCGSCYVASRLRANPAAHERKKLGCRSYYNTHREALIAVEKRRYRGEAESVWERRIFRKYGLTRARFDTMKAAQNDACAICERPFALEIKRPAVDHDHVTGRVRGLLCAPCNITIGHADDCPDLLRRMATYLEERACE